MSFRWKAIGFIASVEGLFSLFFAIIVVSVMQGMIEEQFLKRAQVTAKLFSTTTENAVLATDVASLESFVNKVITNPDLLYARVRNADEVLAEAGTHEKLLYRPFKADQNLSDVDDKVFDTFAEIRLNGELFGRVEIGMATTLLERTITAVRWKVILVGLGEIILSAFISYLLGGLLVKQLSHLQSASKRIANGEMHYRIDVNGEDEIAQTAHAFNTMSAKLEGVLDTLQERNHALDRASTQLKSVLDTAQNGIITINENGMIEQANPCAERIFGYQTLEMVGENISLLIPDLYPSQHEDYLLDGLSHSGHEIEAQRQDGTTVPIWMAVSALQMDTEDSQRRFVAVIADITEQRAAQQTLIEAKEAAESANKAKTDFLHVMSHELRTPLQGARGPLQEFNDQFTAFEGMDILQELVDEIPDVAHRTTIQNALEVLHQEVHEVSSQGLRSAEHLLKLIEEILDFARIEAGKLKVDTVAVEASITVHEVLEMVQHQAAAKGLQLTSSIDEEITILADPMRFKQILLNLMGNAVKFTEQGEISLCAYAKDDHAWFEVSDTGCGIPEDQLDGIFTAFEQVDNSATRRVGGTGLGLPITRKLLKLMRGTIAVESTVEHGSTFRFSLPLQMGQKL
uniref:histidine kinase n=1 Tax=Magnetococcus massalia (strain MO-1) TaxID=451514 RepID=A0A1S7LMY0_MAGMO|nr:Putative histidine kinase with HAMP domain, PAS domain, HisKA domain and HATPase c domain [Candidatus Magnetococcus massalia]